MGDVSWRAQGRPGALAALVTLSLTLLLAAGQAPFDWAWSRGQHATPGQWRAHERFEQRGGVGHHDAVTAPSGMEDVAAQLGTWLDNGGHEAPAPAPDGVQTSGDGAISLLPPVTSQRLPPWAGAPLTGPALAPPVQPPRLTS